MTLLQNKRGERPIQREFPGVTLGSIYCCGTTEGTFDKNLGCITSVACRTSAEVRIGGNSARREESQDSSRTEDGMSRVI